MGVYGGQAPTRRTLDLNPQMRGYDRKSIEGCLIPYMALGWLGHVPAACHKTLIAVPMDYAPYLWGWPHRLTHRLNKVGSHMILLGPWDGSGFTSGINDETTLQNVPSRFDGYLWTDRVEVIGPLLHQHR